MGLLGPSRGYSSLTIDYRCSRNASQYRGELLGGGSDIQGDKAGFTLDLNGQPLPTGVITAEGAHPFELGIPPLSGGIWHLQRQRSAGPDGRVNTPFRAERTAGLPQPALHTTWAIGPHLSPHFIC